MTPSLLCEVNFFYGGAVRRLVKYLTWEVCWFIVGVGLKQREREREEKGERRKGRQRDVVENRMCEKAVRVSFCSSR